MENKPTALVTGATSGIGAEFARQLAGKGCNLILAGREAILRETADRIMERYPVKTDIFIVDFSDPADTEMFVQAIEKREDIEILVNCAGFGHRNFFLEEDYKQLEAMLQVHIGILTRLCWITAGIMKKNGNGTIINVSALSAFFATPTMPLYGATKAFINNFSEALYVSLRKDGIYVQSLCPGFTHTAFHSKLGWSPERTRSKGLARWMTAEQVVTKSLKAAKKKKPLTIPGFTNRLLKYLALNLPRSMYYLISSEYFRREAESKKREYERN